MRRKVVISQKGLKTNKKWKTSQLWMKRNIYKYFFETEMRKEWTSKEKLIWKKWKKRFTWKWKRFQHSKHQESKDEKEWWNQWLFQKKRTHLEQFQMENERNEMVWNMEIRKFLKTKQDIHHKTFQQKDCTWKEKTWDMVLMNVRMENNKELLWEHGSNCSTNENENNTKANKQWKLFKEKVSKQNTFTQGKKSNKDHFEKKEAEQEMNEGKDLEKVSNKTEETFQKKKKKELEQKKQRKTFQKQNENTKHWNKVHENVNEQS